MTNRSKTNQSSRTKLITWRCGLFLYS